MNGEGELTPALRAFMACERARRGYVGWRAVYHRRWGGATRGNPNGVYFLGINTRLEYFFASLMRMMRRLA